MPRTITGTNMEQVSGSFLELTDPRAADVCVEDIAHGLSRLNRVLGQTRRPYSVAEHSVLVRTILARNGQPQAVQLAGLLHDAHEAYIGDVPTPVKRALLACDGFEFAWEELEDRIDRAVGDALGVDPVSFHLDAVRDADVTALRVEVHNLMPSTGEGWKWPAHLKEVPDLGFQWHWDSCPPETAERMFLSAYHELTT